MYARVVRWEDGRADASGRLRGDRLRRRVGAAGGGAGEGVPFLVDPDNGRTMAIALFETEADRRTGDATLNAMSPPGEGLGTRGPVEMYDVAADLREP